MIRILFTVLWISLLSVGAAVTVGCGGAGDEGPCEALSQRVEQCFGTRLSGSCNPATAAALAGAPDCASLSRALMGGKADYGLSDAEREAVREAIREALVQGIRTALEQATSAYADLLGERAFYLMLHESSSRSEAESKRAHFAAAMGHVPEFDPIVYKQKDCLFCSSRYRVLHGACPLQLGQIPGVVVDAVMSNPDLIDDLGGQSEQSWVDDEGVQHVSFSLPLSILPLDTDAPAQLGCPE